MGLLACFHEDSVDLSFPQTSKIQRSLTPFLSLGSALACDKFLFFSSDAELCLKTSDDAICES